jgi:hypothetical protein
MSTATASHLRLAGAKSMPTVPLKTFQNAVARQKAAAQRAADAERLVTDLAKALDRTHTVAMALVTALPEIQRETLIDAGALAPGPLSDVAFGALCERMRIMLAK